jgi:hypothetical protein
MPKQAYYALLRYLYGKIVNSRVAVGTLPYIEPSCIYDVRHLTARAVDMPDREPNVAQSTMLALPSEAMAYIMPRSLIASTTIPVPIAIIRISPATRT